MNGDLDTARLRWAEMREVLSSDGGSATQTSSYFSHWWLSQHEYTAERKPLPADPQRGHQASGPRSIGEPQTGFPNSIRISNPEG